MTTLIWIIASGIAMSCIALLGSVTLALSDATLKKILLPLVAFAAGSLIGGAFFHMIPAAVALRPQDDVRRDSRLCRITRLQAKRGQLVQSLASGMGQCRQRQQPWDLQLRKGYSSFFATKQKGTDLGMAIVKRTVEAPGGSTAVGDGSAFGAEFIISMT